MKEFYSIKIAGANQDQNFAISKIMNLEPSRKDLKCDWIYEIETSQKVYGNIINKFLNLLRDKYDQLEKIGITSDKITIWYLYEYDQQCNMEFEPKQLEELGKNGIKLCISCWEAGSYMEL